MMKQRTPQSGTPVLYSIGASLGRSPGPRFRQPSQLDFSRVATTNEQSGSHREELASKSSSDSTTVAHVPSTAKTENSFDRAAAIVEELANRSRWQLEKRRKVRQIREPGNVLFQSKAEFIARSSEQENEVAMLTAKLEEIRMAKSALEHKPDADKRECDMESDLSNVLGLIPGANLEVNITKRLDWLKLVREQQRSNSESRKQRTEQYHAELRELGSRLTNLSTKALDVIPGEKPQGEFGPLGELDMKPVMTEAELKTLKDAQSNNGLVIEIFGAKLSGKDFRCLYDRAWLNDEMVNQYMLLLRQRSLTIAESRGDEYKPCYFQSSFFYSKLTEDGYSYANVRRWTLRGRGKVDLFSQDKAFFPINLSNKKQIVYYDSMGGAGKQVLDNMFQYLQDEHENKKKCPLDVSGWELLSPKRDVPQQDNGSDCGVFSCTFANYLSLDQPLYFGPVDMPYFRKRIGIDLLHEQAKPTALP